MDNVTASFAAQVFVEDFAVNATKSTSQIDQCVSDGTEGGIGSLFDQPMPSTTGLSLLNYLHLAGVWKVPFSVDSKNASLLTATSTFNYLSQKEFGQLVEVPFNSPSSLSLYLLLPPVNFTGSSISSLLTSGLLEKAVDSLRPETLTITLPGRLSLTGSLSLETLLRKLGVEDAFTGSADFFGVNGDYNLRLYQMLASKATLKLTEGGVEGSAASGLILAPPGKSAILGVNEEKEFKEASTLTSVKLQHSQTSPQNFIADRPFLFLIREKTTQITLLAGVVKRF